MIIIIVVKDSVDLGRTSADVRPHITSNRKKRVCFFEVSVSQQWFFEIFRFQTKLLSQNLFPNGLESLQMNIETQDMFQICF